MNPMVMLLLHTYSAAKSLEILCVLTAGILGIMILRLIVDFCRLRITKRVWWRVKDVYRHDKSVDNRWSW